MRGFAAHVSGKAPHQGFPLTLLGMRGVGGLLARFGAPFIWGPDPTGVGAPDPSSSLMPDGRLRLLDAGDVLALGPPELVPCWLGCSCMPGACI